MRSMREGLWFYVFLEHSNDNERNAEPVRAVGEATEGARTENFLKKKTSHKGIFLNLPT